MAIATPMLHLSPRCLTLARHNPLMMVATQATKMHVANHPFPSTPRYLQVCEVTSSAVTCGAVMASRLVSSCPPRPTSRLIPSPYLLVHPWTSARRPPCLPTATIGAAAAALRLSPSASFASSTARQRVAQRHKGEKSEETVRKEVSVVIIQLNKLEAGGQRRMHHVLKKYAKTFGPECVLMTLNELMRRQDVERALEVRLVAMPAGC